VLHPSLAVSEAVHLPRESVAETSRTTAHGGFAWEALKARFRFGRIPAGRPTYRLLPVRRVRREVARIESTRKLGVHWTTFDLAPMPFYAIQRRRAS
jgi:hypothetical protein